MTIKKNGRQAIISNTKDNQELKTQILTRRKSTKGKSITIKKRMEENQEKHKIQKIDKVQVIVFSGKNTNLNKKKKNGLEKTKNSVEEKQKTV